MNNPGRFKSSRASLKNTKGRVPLVFFYVLFYYKEITRYSNCMLSGNMPGHFNINFTFE